MKSPLLALAACFALGIVLAQSEHPSLPGIPLLLGCSMCLLAGLIALRVGKELLSFLLALAGFVTAGAAAWRLFEFRFPPDHVKYLAAQGIRPAVLLRLEGIVASTPFRTPFGLQFDLDAKRLESSGQFRPVTGRLRLHLQTTEDIQAATAAETLHLTYGDFIRAPVRLGRPRIYQNPGSFDFRRWMESIEDLYWVGTIRSPLLVEKLPGSRAPGLARWLEKTRRRLLESIDHLYPPWSAEGRNGAVLKAVLLGDRTSLDADTVESFRKAGLYHLLVIAGLHVGLLAMLAELFLRLFLVGESWRSAGVLLFLLGYASLVEQRAPTLRATVMIAAYLLARYLYREHAALNAIGLAALLLLLRRPAWLFEAGFQFSFAAALLIVALVAPILERTTQPYRRALRQLQDRDLDPSLGPRQAQFRLDLRDLMSFLKARSSLLERHPSLNSVLVTVPARTMLWIVNMLVFSAILQLGLLLPMAETFHRVSYAGIGLNALAIPVMTLLLAFAFPVVILTALLPPLGTWLARLLSVIMSALFALTDLPHLPPWLSYRVPEPARWLAWGFALSLIIAAWTLNRRGRLFWLSLGALAVFAILISLHPFAPRLPRGSLEVSALDCGGGEALFVVLPDRTTLLAGACGSRGRPAHEGVLRGSRWDPGEDIVSAYLWSRGIRNIDIVLLTDARELHLAGLAAVVRNFHIEELWQGANPSTPATQALLEQVRERGISIRQLAAENPVRRGATSVQVLWPQPFQGSSKLWPAPRRPLNDDSLVVRIAHDQASVLLLGDVSGRVQQELATSASPLKSLVLEATHHRAKSPLSTEFLARVSPRIVVLSGEWRGLSDRSDSETLDPLGSGESRVFRTDRDGAVTVEMKGNRLSVRRYNTSAGEGTTDTTSLRSLTFNVP